ncbi:plasma kallikrein-like isoform X1 [Mya arenaria]|uniref:plasma kallikrein-like isoform X1 n=1 Tax=Mya arenaria TaxID=6604 RepID=UPI0022E80320|nr:plasma kallikrein-like isoform X1 [Mya arenaria]
MLIVILTFCFTTLGVKVVKANAAKVPCGEPLVKMTTKRIVGGTESPAGVWPWMILLEDNNGNFVGSAAIIHPRVLVSSAQLFDAFSSSASHLSDWKMYDSSYRAIPVGRRQTSTVPFHPQKIIVHPQYNTSNLQNDIVLIITESALAYNAATRPVCLPDSGHRYAIGDVCYLAGWGDTATNGDSSILRHITLPILPDSVCMNHWTDVLPETEICAGYENGQKDFCANDIGGPLVCKGSSNGKWYMQGIASSGGNCAKADEPGLFEDVLIYADWIKTTMGANGFPYEY